jgi:hypothetical protein
MGVHNAGARTAGLRVGSLSPLVGLNPSDRQLKERPR